jgi:hypothetical protein
MEQALHHGNIEPAVKFSADLGFYPHEAKPTFFV